jgi:hypothetical protein
MSRSASITLGEMRVHGCRDLLVYCRSLKCNHSITMNADHLPDDTLVRPLSKRMVCTKRPGRRRRPAGLQPAHEPDQSRCP